MILIDANLLIYAYDGSSSQHGPARQWLEDTLSGPALVRLSWTTVLAFLRITTHPTVFATPFAMSEATSRVQAWLQRPGLELLLPTARHWQILLGLLDSAKVKGSLVSDAQLAALAIEHGATLYSTDRDFRRFEGLRWVDPLS